MQTKILKNAGLTDVQAEIYAFLLENGENKASNIAKKTKRPRGVVYKGLDDLLVLTLVEKNEKQGITRFKAEHPSNLEKVLEQKEKEAKQEINNKKNRLEIEKKSVLNAIPDLASTFNLISGKPGIKFYEGLEGVKKVIYDTFNATETVYTFADIETINKYIKEINEKYAKKRDQLGLNKKIIFSDTPYTRQYLPTYHSKTTDSKIISNLSNFSTIMQIYNNKISYVTLSDKVKIGVIIENKDIYHTHRMLFEHLWENAISVDQL